MKTDAATPRFRACISGVATDIANSYVKIGEVEAGGSAQFWVGLEDNYYLDVLSVPSGDGTATQGGASWTDSHANPCTAEDGFISVTSTGESDIYIFADIYYNG